MFEDQQQIEISSLPRPQKKKRFLVFGKIPLYLMVTGGIFLAFFSYQVISSDDALLKRLLLGSLGFLSVSPDKQLIGEESDRINVLLMGIGGAGHEGGQLTDTIILASYKPSTKQLALLSIPRDLSVSMGPYQWRKINSANALAELDQPGSGPKFAAQVVSDLVGMDIPYYVRIDFSGFKSLIDEFDGLDVYVENDLIDNQYPIKGKEYVYPLELRFEKLYIPEGWQHFDGATALKFVRSRHGRGSEGSDFARSKRQQIVLLALKEKILTYKTLLSPSKINALLRSYRKNVATNFELWEIARLASFTKDFETANLINRVLDSANGGPLISNNYNGAYVLEPINGDYELIKQIAQGIFEASPETAALAAGPAIESSTEVPPKPNRLESKAVVEGPPPSIRSPKLEILNGTNINGLASEQIANLEAWGFEVVRVANAITQDRETTRVYNFSENQFPFSGRALAYLYDTELEPNPGGLESEADFVLILGFDQAPEEEKEEAPEIGESKTEDEVSQFNLKQSLIGQPQELNEQTLNAISHDKLLETTANPQPAS